MSDREKLGRVLVDLGYYDIPEHLANYIDYEAIGRDYDLGTSGEFVECYFVELNWIKKMAHVSHLFLCNSRTIN